MLAWRTLPKLKMECYKYEGMLTVKGLYEDFHVMTDIYMEVTSATELTD